jgi:hypothetical protein
MSLPLAAYQCPYELRGDLVHNARAITNKTGQESWPSNFAAVAGRAWNFLYGWPDDYCLLSPTKVLIDSPSKT